MWSHAFALVVIWIIIKIIKNEEINAKNAVISAKVKNYFFSIILPNSAMIIRQPLELILVFAYNITL